MCICVFNSTIHDVQSLFITTNSQLSFIEMKKVYHKNKKKIIRTKIRKGKVAIKVGKVVANIRSNYLNLELFV